MSKNSEYPYVEVQWLDAHSRDGWLTVSEFPKLAPIVTRGWLVAQDKLTLVIAGTHAPADDGDTEQFGEVIAIPKAWAKVKKLKVK